MAKENPIKEPVAAAAGTVIAHPANAGAKMNVEAPYAPPQDPPSDGLLCSADGTATPTDNQNAIKMVWVLVDFPNVNHDETDIASDSRARCFIVPTPRNGAPNIPWSFSNADTLWCPTEPSGQSNAKIWVLAFEGDENGFPEEVTPLAVKSRAFEGVGVQSCSAMFRGGAKHEVTNAAAPMLGQCCSPVATGVLPHVHEGSCGIIGDWLHYRRLSAGAINGHRLVDETGKLLSASVVAVACKDVRWQPSSNSALTVRASHAHVAAKLRPAPVTGPLVPLFKWKFPELPPYCVVLYQPPKTPTPNGPAYELAYVVSSNCPDHPDILSLDPNEPVLVTVNDRLIDYSDNRGSFSLLLSVIED